MKSVNINIPNEKQMDPIGREVLLLYRKVNVINPLSQEIQNDVIALFDTDSQTSFISRKLAKKLKLETRESDIMRIASF